MSDRQRNCHYCADLVCRRIDAYVDPVFGLCHKACHEAAGGSHE